MSQKPVLFRPATFMSVEPAELTDGSRDPYLVISLEKTPGEVDQIAITHDDGHMLLNELVQAMNSQGCPAAEKVLRVLNEINNDQNEEVDEGYDPESGYQEEERQTAEDQDDDDTDNGGTGPTDEADDPTGPSSILG